MVSKVVCPDCGGNLIIEHLYQYGLQQTISHTGRILNRIKKVDNGSMEADLLFCSKCKRNFSEDEYSIIGNFIQLDVEAEDCDD